MFVKFRRTPKRLAAALIESRRVDGAVRPEHVASLGSIAVDPITVAGRVAFWRELHKRLDKLGNRIGDEKFKILEAIHAQIPMVTVDEIPALQRRNFESEETFWSGVRDDQQERAAALRQHAANILSQADEAEALAKTAGEKVAVAKDKLAKLHKGEAMTGGLGEEVTCEQMLQWLKADGWSAADFRHMENVVALTEEELERSNKEAADWHERAERAHVRKILRDRERA